MGTESIMNLNAASLAPEIFLSIMVCIVLVVGLYSRVNYSFPLSIASLVVTAIVLAAGADSDAVRAMNGMYADDLLASVLKICICLVSAGVLVYSRRYVSDRNIPGYGVGKQHAAAVSWS